MLELVVEEKEFYDDSTGKFIILPRTELLLEHSLYSISKWESIHKKPFLSKTEHTNDEIMDYIRCMTINKKVDPIVYTCLGGKEMETIMNYMQDEMTATTIKQKESKMNREIITAEIVYYWMVSLGIPFECDKWHFNKLMTLISVCSIKNAPSKKMSQREALMQQNQLNDLRRAKLGSLG